MTIITLDCRMCGNSWEQVVPEPDMYIEGNKYTCIQCIENPTIESVTCGDCLRPECKGCGR